MAMWMGGLGTGARVAGLTFQDVSKTIKSLENIAETTNSEEAFVERASKLPNISAEDAKRIRRGLQETQPELFAHEDGDAEEYTVTQDMQFKGLHINPDKADEHWAAFSTAGQEGGARSRVVIPFALNELDEGLEVRPLVDISEATAQRLAEEVSQAENKKTAVFVDGKEYVSEAAPGEAEHTASAEASEETRGLASAEDLRWREFSRERQEIEQQLQETAYETKNTQTDSAQEAGVPQSEGLPEAHGGKEENNQKKEIANDERRAEPFQVETRVGKEMEFGSDTEEGRSGLQESGIPERARPSDTSVEFSNKRETLPQRAERPDAVVEPWIDPETGLRVKADPETGKLSASVVRGAQVDLNNAQAFRERAIANYKNAHKESGQEKNDSKLAMTGERTAELSAKQKRLLEIAAKFLERKLPAGLEYNVKENPDMPAGRRGSFDTITKAIEVKSAEDVAALVHEMLHQFYLTLTDAEIDGFKKLFAKSDPETQKKYDPETRLGAEKFADEALDYLSRTNMAKFEAQSPVRRALQKIADFLKDLWDALSEFVRGESKADIDAYFHKIFGRNTERKGYNATLTEALSLNLQKEIAQTVSVRGIQSALFASAQAQAGAKTVFLNGKPLSETNLRDHIKAFQDTYQKAYQKAQYDAVKYKTDLQQYKTGKLNPRSLIHVGNAPRIYANKGLPAYTIRLEGRVIEKATNPAIKNHNVDIATIERLPELLASPVALFKSMTVKGAFISVIDAKDLSGRPVIVVQKDAKKERITTIQSIYGRNNFDGFIEKNRKAGTIIAVDKGKATKYLRPGELQLLPDSVFDDLFSVSSNSIEKSSVADIFSRDDAGARADQDAVWSRAFKILGAWAEEHAFGSADQVVLSDGLAVSDREIMDFIAPAVSAGLVKGADTKAIKPLYMEDVLPGASEEDIAFGAKVFDEVTGKYLMEAAFAARGMYSGFDEAYSEFKRLVAGDEVIADLGTVSAYFRAFFDNYETLLRKRDADGMVDPVSESSNAGKVTLSEWADFVHSDAGLDEILQTVLAQNEALTKDSFTAAESEREQALNRFLFPQMRRAVKALREGRAVPDSLKGMLRGILANRIKRDVFKNLYGVLTGDERYISNEDALAEMMGASELSSEVISRLMRKWSFSEAVSEILGSRLKEGSREEIARREAELDFNAEELEAEIAGYEAEIGEEFKGDLIGYREGLVETAKTAAAGKDVNSGEFKKFREGLMEQIFELRQFEEWRGKLKEGQLGALEKMALLQEKMSVDARRSLRLMSEAVLNLQRIRAQEGAVRELKRMTDKLYYSIFKKVSSDVDLAYADEIENVQAVLGSKSLAKYLGNLHSSGLSLETFAADYMENAEYRGKIDAVLDESARVRLQELLYDGEGKPRVFGKLSSRELQSLGYIFANSDAVQKAKIRLFLEKVQQDSALLTGAEGIMTASEYKKVKRRLFNADGSPRDVNTMSDRVLSYLVRRLTGAPEWSESLSVQEFDASARKEAARAIQESTLFTEEEKALLSFKEDGSLVLNLKGLDDVAAVAGAVARIKKAGQTARAEFLSARNLGWERETVALGDRVPVFVGGQRLNARKDFRGEWKDGQAYKAGDLAVSGGTVYRALADTSSALSDKSWAVAVSVDDPQNDRGLGHRLKSYFITHLRPAYVGELMFDEAGLAPEEKLSYRYIIRGRERAYQEMTTRETLRLGMFYKMQDKLGIKDRDFARHTFTADTFGQVFRLDQAMYLWAARRNRRSYNAVAGGVFLTADERAKYGKSPKVDKELTALARTRYKRVLDQYEAFLKTEGNEKYQVFLDFILEDLDKHYKNLKDFMGKYYNKRVTYEDYYIPIIRNQSIGTVDENYESMVSDIFSSAGRDTIETGMTQDRLDIDLGHQGNINYNLFDVYFQHVHQVEKLTAYAPWVAKMKYIFEGKSSGSLVLQDRLRRAFGSGADEGAVYWRRILREEINDAVYKADSKLNQTIYAMRGNVTKNMILLRASTLLTQLVTSTAVSMGQVTTAELMRDGIPILFDPEVMRAMLDSNAVMENRWRQEDIQHSPLPKIQDYEVGTGKGKWLGLKPLLRSAEEFGGEGLKGVDRISVAPLFHAVYMRELRKGIAAVKAEDSSSTLEYNENNPYEVFGGKAKEAEAVKQRAIELANEVINSTQPSNELFQKPLAIRDSRGLNSILTIFQNPLSILFNELAWGMPTRLKADFKGNALMVANGLAWIGLSMAAMGFIRDADKDDWREGMTSEEVARRILSYLLGSQGLFGSLPIFGAFLGGVAHTAILGKNDFRNFGSSLAPGFDAVTRLFQDLSNREDGFTLGRDALRIGLQYVGLGAGLMQDIEASEEMLREKGWVRAWLRMFGVR